MTSWNPDVFFQYLKPQSFSRLVDSELQHTAYLKNRRRTCSSFVTAMAGRLDITNRILMPVDIMFLIDKNYLFNFKGIWKHSSTNIPQVLQILSGCECFGSDFWIRDSSLWRIVDLSVRPRDALLWCGPNNAGSNQSMFIGNQCKVSLRTKPSSSMGTQK